MSTQTLAHRPSAHPYEDTTVIDKNAPRTNQAAVGLVTLIALLTGLEWLVAVMFAQLVIGLTLGRKYCLPCVFYFEVIQPRTGEGELEDSRPPRFANMMAAGFTGTATLLFVLGLGGAGWVVTGIVCVVAIFSAASGFCVGCWMHRRVYGHCEVCDLPVKAPNA